MTNSGFIDTRLLRAAGVAPTKVPTVYFSIGEIELQSLSVKETLGDYAAWNSIRRALPNQKLDAPSGPVRIDPENRDRTSFLFETRGVLILKLLDGDQTIETRVACLPDLTHTTSAKRGQDLVGAKFVADREPHDDELRSV